jgi:hypothetical protein
MKIFKISLIAASIISVFLFASCNDHDSNGNSHGNNQPAANTEKDSTSLMPKENVKTAQEDYRDTSHSNPDSTAMGTEKR